jgi:predicted class III extradiol MEMO1 family dioxygenase
MNQIREPVVAGTFYPFDPGHLKEQLNSLFSGIKTEQKCLGAVSPHAGYEYSGRTAAFAISSLRQAKTFVVLGPNHQGFGAGFSIMGSGAWRTPLGEVAVNPDISRELIKSGIVQEDSTAHLQEHSIEVQLPFLQHRFGTRTLQLDMKSTSKSNASAQTNTFDFVPICIMNTGYSGEFLKECKTLGAAIARTIKGKGIGVIASSDFSHYLPAEVAEEKDSRALKKIIALDTKGLFKILEETSASVCGYGPIAVLMAAAKELGLKARLINKSNSGDSTGDYNSVVAYYAIGFE